MTCPPERLRGAAKNLVAALERHRRQKLAVGQVFETVAVAADADFAFDRVIVRRDVLVVDRPVFSGAVVSPALEVALAESQGDSVPQHRLAADAAAALRIEPCLARPHGRDLTIGEVEGERVRVEVGARVDPRAALDQGNPRTATRQVRCESPAGGAGTNNDDVERVGLHAKRGRLCVLIGAQSTATQRGRSARDELKLLRAQPFDERVMAEVYSAHHHGIRLDGVRIALGERGRATVDLCPGWHVESDRTHQGDGVAPCDRPGLHAVVELDVAVLEPIREMYVDRARRQLVSD